MPKGDIVFKNGTSTHYDAATREGDLVVFKRSYSLDVQVVRSSEVKEINSGEWHRTPFGYCRGLSQDEVSSAVAGFRRKSE